MGILDDYHRKKDQEHQFDFDAIMSDEMKRFDSTVPPRSLYKFVPQGRFDFFQRPLLRFTQRIGLNDPFELMKRWNEFASEPVRKAVVERVKNTLNGLNEDKHILLAMLKEQAAQRGIFLGPDDIAKASTVLLSPEGRQQIASAIMETSNTIESQSEALFTLLTKVSEYAFSEATSKFGILSLTDKPNSRVMWSTYASEGRGFMIEFDTEHRFFAAPNGRKLIWQVNYRDEPQGSYLENPMALFMTKHTDYSFESEWRMLKQLTECDEVVSRAEGDMHMVHVLPGMIKSITFGYNFDPRELAICGAQITTNFDKEIKLRWISPNRSSGAYDFCDLTPPG